MEEITTSKLYALCERLKYTKEKDKYYYINVNKLFKHLKEGKQ